MTDIGFKKLTEDNWLEPDATTLVFLSSLRRVDGTGSLTRDELVKGILKPNLIETVPLEVRRLFEVARGAVIYGYFFYPLYSLAGEQLFRVAEAAVTLKCKTLGAPISIDNFQKKIDFLICNRIISREEENSWHAVRELRNISSHPKDINIIPPNMVVDEIAIIADKVNFLFSNR